MSDSAWHSIFPDGLMDAEGVEVPLERLQGKVVGLYFSASWCLPCHRFTPLLTEFRNEHQEDFEVVLVGRDSLEDKQLAYMEEFKMPFLGTRWANGKNTQSDNLDAEHKVSGIPRLVILSPNGEVLIKNAREAVESSPEDITSLFTDIEKRDKLAAKFTKEAEMETETKNANYRKALDENFPPRGKDHQTTQVAQYSFDSTADDSLKKNSAFTLKNTPYKDGALDLNGVFSNRENGYAASVAIEDFRYTQFSIGQEFLIRDYSDRGPTKATAIVVGGKSYRWFGLECDSKGSMELFFNSGRFFHSLPVPPIALNEWNKVLVSVDLYQGIVKVWFNGELLPAIELPEDFMLTVIPSKSASRDANFNYTNFSTAETINGLVDNLIIFDGPLTESEMSQEAEAFGSRWNDQ
ncbi:MAG: thioredoxin-like domain-containing protein [Fuerstiella sp.]